MANFLENLVLTNENIKDLRELINVNTLRDERISDYVRVVAARSGDRLGLISGVEIGTAGCACDPTYVSMNPTDVLKVWALGCWEAPLKVCSKDMEGTIAEYALRNGSNIGDLTGTQVLSEVIEPLLKDSNMDMIFRLAWFGDTAAATIANGGSITNGTDLKLINVCDGFWKRIYTQVTANSSQKTAITTNTKAAMTASGAATALIEQMIVDAPAALMAKTNKVIYMTNAMKTALTLDMKKTYSCALPWTVLTDGVTTTEFDGIQYVAIGKWDEHIAAYENGAKPYRALLTVKDNLLLGTPAGEFVEDFDLFFDRTTRNFHMYGTGKIGTMLLEDGMFQAAY